MTSSARFWPSSVRACRLEAPSAVGYSGRSMRFRSSIASATGRLPRGCEPVADIGAVLVERGRREAVDGWGAGQPDRIAHGGHGVLADLDDRLEAEVLGELDAASNGVDRPAGQPGVGEDPEPVLRALAR